MSTPGSHRRGRQRAAALFLGLALGLPACTPDPSSVTDHGVVSDDADGEVAPPDDVEPEPEPEDAPAVDDQEPSRAADAVPDLGIHAVSAGDVAAVDAGLSVLEAGGSAVDATIAAALAVSVVEPFASGLGGGGAALVAVPGEDPVAYDYREVVAQDGRIPSTDTGIPGFAAGMRALHDDHGTLPWAELVTPAVALADEGAPVSTILADQLRSAAYRLPIEDLPEFFPDGEPLDEGDQLLQPELAATLQRLADDGPDDLYTGAVADELATAVEGIDGASLAAYTVQREPPARGRFADYEIVAPAPALPGAPFVQQMQVAEALDVGSVAPDTADHLHRMLMAWRIADASVSSDLGDPAFVEVPVDALTDPVRNAELAAGVSDGTLLDVVTAEPGDIQATAVGEAAPSSAGNTTHVTVVGSDGTVVSMTNTLTNFWGSGERELGFFLNDQMRRFSIGGDATNAPEPGRRSVSWGLPILVLDDQGRPVLGAGSPGGRRIPTILANVLVRWALHDEPLQAAVDAPRYHLEGSTLEFETPPSDAVAEDLLGRGYAGLDVPDPVYYFGSVQALEVDHDAGEIVGASDPRREGTWRAEPS